MTLKYPLVLFLFPAILFLLYWGVQRGSGRRVLSFPLAQRNFRIPSQLRLPLWLPFLFRCLAFLLAVIALARPQSSSSETRRLSEGIDIVIALDVSQSMTIEDGADEKNRLDVAKEVVKKFIAGRQDDRIGFVMFAGEAVTLCPPTLDYPLVLDAVERARIGILKDGTAIGEALAVASTRLKDSRAKSRVVILITDGDNNMGSIAPLTAGDIAAGYGIKVYSIALGKEGAVRYPVYGTNFFGQKQKVYQQITSSINPALLMKISEETKGKFFRANDENSLERVFAEINKLERNKVETKDRVLWEEHFQPFLLAALFFFLIDLLLRRTIFRVLPE